MTNLIKKYFSIADDLDTVQNINDTINQGIRFKGAALITLVFAIFIASLGLNINSTAVVIGAMLISPLMGPIIGIGFGASTYNIDIIKDALKNYLLATVISLITSTIYFYLSPLDEAKTEILSRTTPTIYDVLIALIGGFAGITALTTKYKVNILSGVAIATALMPPLCTAGYGFATGQFGYSLGALYLYFINTVFIILSVFLYLKIINFTVIQDKNDKKIKKTNRIILALSIITILPSIYLGYDLVQENKFIRNANKFINKEFDFRNSFVVKKIISRSENKIEIFLSGVKIDSIQLNNLRHNKDKYLLFDTKIEINQGATFDKTSDNKSINIDQFEKANNLISNKLDSAINVENLYSIISKEIKYIEYDLDTSYIVNNALFESNDHNKIITIILQYKPSKDLKLIDTVRISNWLKVKLPQDSIHLKFIK